MTKKIFISYAKKDARDIALALANALGEVDGLEVWIDRSLQAGRSWELQIQQQIDDCDVMIVLYSPDINRHKLGQPESYVLTEIAYAKYTAKKPIIPVMAVATDPPMALTMEHYIDFATGDVMHELVNELCAELEAYRQYSTGSHGAASSVHDFRSQSRTISSAEVIRSIIGGPFEWCEIDTFAMAKYPVTYSQFQRFIEDSKGFTDNRWWQGFAQRSSRVPTEQKWKYSHHPRENVDWYSAVAFCRWLSWKLGGPHEVDRLAEWPVRLPTLYEWEDAASGRNDRQYPWGNEFDVSRCNTAESGFNRTTPVTKHPKGMSPFGVMDMSGNVWEWCLSVHDAPEIDVHYEDICSLALREIRGGSWCHNSYSASIPGRNREEPLLYGDNLGFRIMRPL